MHEHIWRLSGRDGRRHAFHAEGDYIPTRTMTAVFTNLQTGQCHTCEVEFFRSACGLEIPVAALMPHDHGLTCQNCDIAPVLRIAA